MMQMHVCFQMLVERKWLADTVESASCEVSRRIIPTSPCLVEVRCENRITRPRSSSFREAHTYRHACLFLKRLLPTVYYVDQQGIILKWEYLFNKSDRVD